MFYKIFSVFWFKFPEFFVFQIVVKVNDLHLKPNVNICIYQVTEFLNINEVYVQTILSVSRAPTSSVQKHARVKREIEVYYDL